MPSNIQTQNDTASVSTAKALYLVYRALPKKDRLAVARYILNDEDIRQNIDFNEIPNEITLKAFAEKKSTMSVFESVDDLRKDLLS